MKIAVTGTRGVPHIMGGVETHCEELYPRLSAMEYDITIIRRSAYVDREVDMCAGVTNKRWNGIELIDLTSPKRKSLECIIHTTKAVIMAKRIKADLIHIHTIGACLLAPLARLLGLKVVFTHHGPDYDREKWGWFAKIMLKMGEWCGCKCAHHVIVISDVIKNLIAEKHGRKKNVHLIYNGVPAPVFHHDPAFFNSLGIEEGQYILSMARIVPEKNMHQLIETYGRLKAKGRIPEEIKLVLVGDTDFNSEYSRRLRRMAEDKGVVMTGFVFGDKLHALLTHARCFCLPSSHEGLSIALLEAMSYHLPVVVADIPANLEMGLAPTCYHEVNNVAALADRLDDICHNPLFRVEYDMSKYDWDFIARQVAEVYQLMTLNQ